MPITFEPQGRIFHLSTRNSSYLFNIFDHDYLFHAYWGRRLHTVDLTRLWQLYPSGFSPNYDGAPDVRYSLDLIPAEYPVYGSGDFHAPAVMAVFPDGSRLLDLKYKSYSILPGKRKPDGLPGLEGNSDTAETLEVVLEDAPTGLQVVLVYAVFADIDIITRSARIVNATGAPVRLTRALSMSVDLPLLGDYEMIGLYGNHAMERKVERKPLRHGGQSVESTRGASSHQHNPFIALAAPDAAEDKGEVYAAAFVYSGNFLAAAEMDNDDRVRLQMGIHPMDFSWQLEAGESFVTPETARCPATCTARSSIIWATRKTATSPGPL